MPRCEAPEFRLGAQLNEVPRLRSPGVRASRTLRSPHPAGQTSRASHRLAASVTVQCTAPSIVSKCADHRRRFTRLWDGRGRHVSTVSPARL
jgi:hypothetical protein